MSIKRVGNLQKHDPLYGFLKHQILPQLACKIHRPEFRVFQLTSTNNKVFLYEEKGSQTKIVGKFFADGLHQSIQKASERASREYQNLHDLRNCGFASSPQQVIKPLAYKADLNHLLLEEFAHGMDLGKVINKSLGESNPGFLFHKLKLLAHFLVALHNRTANGYQVDFNRDCHYFSHLQHQLKGQNVLSNQQSDHFHHLCHQWKSKAQMWEDQQVLVHGDATPVNFIFGARDEVTAIDLERMKYGDRIFDIGRIVGELQHYFMHAGRHKSEAEPFIGHFLWEYCSKFPNQQRAFRSITRRLPFQIAVTLMRIARNSWIHPEYRHKLVREAKLTLEAK